MFEYLMEHGAAIPSDEEIDGAIVVMLQRRHDWVHRVVAIAHRWHIPFTAIRVIHQYVVGFNWTAVREALSAMFTKLTPTR